MKHINTIIAFSASMLALLSCAKKEMVSNDENGFSPLVIRAVVDEDVTKTTYTDNGSAYEFSWNQNDYVAIQVYKGGSSTKPDQIKFKAQSDGATTTLVQDGYSFDLSDDHNVAGYSNKNYTLGDYAFYPRYATSNNNDLLYTRNASGTGDGDSSTDYVKLHESIPYVPSNPSSVIPIIGKKESGNGTPNTLFKFKTATGILKISLKQIPTGATKLVLTSKTATDELSGEYLFAEETTYNNGIVMGVGTKNYTNTKTVTFSDLSGLDTYTDFYVPIPVGSINGLVVDIKKDDNTLLWRISTDAVLSITRGVVTELPSFDMTGKGVTSFSVSGTSANPGLTFAKSGITRICANFSTSSTNDPSAYPDGLHFENNSVNNYQLATWNTAKSASPELQRLTDASTSVCYLHYVALSSGVAASTLSGLSDKRVKAYGTIPFYFLSATDNSALVGTFNHATTDECKSANSPADIPATASFSFIASTDPANSNIMISSVDGTACSLSIPGMFDGTSITLTGSYLFVKSFASDKFLMNYPSKDDLVLNFTNAAKSAFYVSASQFGVQHYDTSWYYVYYSGSEHVYTKE